MRKVFQAALEEVDDLIPSEREALNEMVSTLTNVEELLGESFAGFFTRKQTLQKRYFYLSWLLWSYVHLKQIEFWGRREKSFYKSLADLGAHNVITFNYTRFFFTDELGTIAHFHGDCRSVINFHTRELIESDKRIEKARTPQELADFIKALATDWDKDPPAVSLPGLVPPLCVKPIICLEYLEQWAQAASRLGAADRIVIVGYSFNAVDEHFNDLLRKRGSKAQIIVINPNADAVRPLLCRVLGIEQDSFSKRTAEGFEAWSSGRVLLAKAKAEDLSKDRLRRLVTK